METPESTRIEVRNEPLTYQENGRFSYFKDLATKKDNNDSRLRIERHEQEMRVVNEEREARTNRTLESRGIEVRTSPSSTPGQGGYFDIPLWLNEYFATAVRPSRVLTALVPNFPLPVGAHSINLPRLTLGNADQPQQDDSAVPGQDVTDAAVNATVCTFAGQGDVALQLLEQSPAGAHLDWAFFKDLTEAYDAQICYQSLFGTGANENFLGITNLSGTAAIAFSSSSPTFSGLYPSMGQVSAQIGNKRRQAPGVWLMNTSRWSWIATSFDNQGRPIVTPDAHAPIQQKSPDGVDAVSTMWGWPVYVDDSIPNSLNSTGVGTGQDMIILCKPEDLMLLEGTPKVTVNLESLSGTLQARLQLRNYAAFVSGRYPTGIGWVYGTGMTVQTGFY